MRVSRNTTVRANWFAMTDKLVEGAEYHQRLAASWTAGYQSGGFGRRIRVMCSILEDRVRPGSRWLDAGCGTGIISRELCALGANVIGVDASPNMLAVAETESQGEPKITYRLIDSIEDTGLEGCAFDGVLCSSVIEYIAAPEAAIGEFARLLQHGGQLVLSVPNRYSLVRLGQKLCRAAASPFGSELFSYLAVSEQEFSVASVRHMIEEAGFELQEVIRFDPVLPQFMNHLGLGSLIVLSARLETKSVT